MPSRRTSTRPLLGGSTGSDDYAAIIRDWPLLALLTGLAAAVPSTRCGSVFGTSSTRAVAQVGATSDLCANDGALPCSGGLAARLGPSLFRRRALIPAMTRRAASRLASLAGFRKGSVPIRKGQKGQSTAEQSATSFSW